MHLFIFKAAIKLPSEMYHISYGHRDVSTQATLRWPQCGQHWQILTSSTRCCAPRIHREWSVIHSPVAELWCCQMQNKTENEVMQSIISMQHHVPQHSILKFWIWSVLSEVLLEHDWIFWHIVMTNMQMLCGPVTVKVCVKGSQSWYFF